jgi:hypothetical protein
MPRIGKPPISLEGWLVYYLFILVIVLAVLLAFGYSLFSTSFNTNVAVFSIIVAADVIAFIVITHLKSEPKPIDKFPGRSRRLK